MALTIGLTCVSGVGHAQPAAQIRWEGERLSVRAADAPLAGVMTDVARLTGLEVTGSETLTGTTAATFTDLPLTDALKELLAGVNYLLQEVPGPQPGARGRLVLRIYSSSPTTAASSSARTPITVPALEAVAAADATAEAEARGEDEDDPDVAEEQQDARLEAARMASEGVFGPDASVDSLVELMEDTNPEVRVEAVRALASRPMKSALPILGSALADDAVDVRAAAVQALGAARDADSMKKMGDILVTHPNLGLRLEALRVLALRADPAAIPYLRKVEAHPDGTLRQAAAQMLEEFDRRARMQASPR
jgi:hypothetical protein